MKTKMSKEEFDEEFLTIIKDGKNNQYQAGLAGEACAIVPKLTADTTEEEELQMIYESIESLRIELGQGVLPPEVLEVLVLFFRILIGYYRNGLSARNLSKECPAKEEIA
jgi:hypothetical protein